MLLAFVSQPLHAADKTCHYNATELKQILGTELSAMLTDSAVEANIGGARNSDQPALHCDGDFISIDLSPLPDLTTLRLNIPTANVQEQYPFVGLASYYQRLQGVNLNSEQTVTPLALPTDDMPMIANEWTGVQGRYEVFLVAAPTATVRLTEAHIELRWRSETLARQVRIFLGKPSDETLAGTQQQAFSSLRYAHLWGWLAGLCLAIEKLMLLLHGAISVGWGITIILLAVTLKLLLLPVSLLTAKAQANVNRLQAQLQPKLNAIKANYDGEDAHQRSMAAYKSLGVSPFFALRPLPGTLIQLPVLVATFNVLGEMPQLYAAEFLWINNLAYPDAVALLPFTVPAMGDGLNLLPFIMFLVSVLATLAFSAPHSSAADTRRQKRNLYLMSAAFFFLFYPFPAAMVLYWTVNNLLQLIQQRLLR